MRFIQELINFALFKGELIRTDMHGSDGPVIFTSRPFQLPKLQQIRLVDENDNSEVEFIIFACCFSFKLFLWANYTFFFQN